MSTYLGMLIIAHLMDLVDPLAHSGVFKIVRSLGMFRVVLLKNFEIHYGLLTKII